MIAKTFEKFNYTSVGISTLLLFGASYYYTTLEINWSFVDSKTLNGILIFGALLLSIYAIDTVTRQLSIERSNRNAYHLLLWLVIVEPVLWRTITNLFHIIKSNKSGPILVHFFYGFLCIFCHTFCTLLIIMWIQWGLLSM